MPPRIHPCVCGVVSKTHGGMRKHRTLCQAWQDRPNPRGLSIARRQQSKSKETREVPCPACGGLRQQHTGTCPHDPGEASRLETLLRNGVDPKFFRVFLRYLARCYERDNLRAG